MGWGGPPDLAPGTYIQLPHPGGLRKTGFSRRDEDAAVPERPISSIPQRAARRFRACPSRTRHAASGPAQPQRNISSRSVLFVLFCSLEFFSHLCCSVWFCSFLFASDLFSSVPVLIYSVLLLWFSSFLFYCVLLLSVPSFHVDGVLWSLLAVSVRPNNDSFVQSEAAFLSLVRPKRTHCVWILELQKK